MRPSAWLRGPRSATHCRRVAGRRRSGNGDAGNPCNARRGIRRSVPTRSRALRGGGAHAGARGQRHLPHVPLGRRRQGRDRQVDRRRRRRSSRPRFTADEAEVHRVPRGRLGRQAPARREAQARQLRDLPRQGGERVCGTVHGQARKGGNDVAATCTDCHGKHDILRAKDPASRTNHANIEATCSQCHGNDATMAQGEAPGGNIGSKFHDSIHGKALKSAAQGSAPTCTNCHGAHNIRAKSEEAKPHEPRPGPGHLRHVPQARARRIREGHARQAAAGRRPRGARMHRLPQRARDPGARQAVLPDRGDQGVRQLPRRLPRPTATRSTVR